MISWEAHYIFDQTEESHSFERVGWSPSDQKADTTHRWHEEGEWEYLIRCRIERAHLSSTEGFHTIYKDDSLEATLDSYAMRFVVISENFKGDQIFLKEDIPEVEVGQEILLWMRFGERLGVMKRREQTELNPAPEVFVVLLTTPSPMEVLGEIVEHDLS